MSYKASAYASRVCESTKLSTSARLVLYVMAETANGQTGRAYGGATVTRRSGLHQGSVRRAIAELVAAGVLGVDSARPGRATVYRFPVVLPLSTTRAGERGSRAETLSTPAPGSAPPAPGSAPPAPGSARTCLCTGACTCPRSEFCSSDCPLCEGGQYISDPDAPYAMRCPGRAALEEVAM